MSAGVLMGAGKCYLSWPVERHTLLRTNFHHPCYRTILTFSKSVLSCSSRRPVPFGSSCARAGLIGETVFFLRKESTPFPSSWLISFIAFNAYPATYARHQFFCRSPQHSQSIVQNLTLARVLVGHGFLSVLAFACMIYLGCGV